MQIEFHPAANQELLDATGWYATRCLRASQEVIEEVKKALKRICDALGHFEHIEFNLQSCTLSRFPFRILSRHQHPRVTMIAVPHFSREPTYWHQRSE